MNLKSVFTAFALGLFLSGAAQAEEKPKYLIYSSVAQMLFPEDSFAFYLTEEGDFYHYKNKKAVRVGYEADAADLAEIKKQIKSLPGSLTSIKSYEDFECPGDPDMMGGMDTVITTFIKGRQFKDGRLDIDLVKKDCVWKKVNPKHKKTINSLMRYFDDAEMLMLKNR